LDVGERASRGDVSVDQGLKVNPIAAIDLERHVVKECPAARLDLLSGVLDTALLTGVNK
jgi:hypothetical protein